MATATWTRVRWVAGPDGTAHAHPARRLPRTLCGLPALDERFAWPERGRCLDCWASQATSALPEKLLLAGYGVRLEPPIGS